MNDQSLVRIQRYVQLWTFAYIWLHVDRGTLRAEVICLKIAAAVFTKQKLSGFLNEMLCIFVAQGTSKLEKAQRYCELLHSQVLIFLVTPCRNVL